jgi:hypothetical protein
MLQPESMAALGRYTCKIDGTAERQVWSDCTSSSERRLCAGFCAFKRTGLSVRFVPRRDNPWSPTQRLFDREP